MLNSITTSMATSETPRPRGVRCSHLMENGSKCGGRALRTGPYTMATGCQRHASSEERAIRKAWFQRIAIRRAMRASA